MNAQPLALWGGIECTVNRVGDRFCDQLAFTGHAQRLDDLDLFAALGLRTLRYPLLWELNAPHSTDEIAWSWLDTRMTRLRELGVTPIAGLVHHGSGPAHTSLVHEGFARGLADYAGRIAARYPWIEAYTPVNEPLTTARFSGLYGAWYPHGRDDRTFARALVNECRGIADAMVAIRRVNSRAQLVQTDDLGEVFSTPGMRYQADFENERRWLAWDLLCGRVEPSHPMYGFLRGAGVSVTELAQFIEHPCPPDVIGINHYVLSDRYLDEERSRYPQKSWGSNARETYADVDAVRVGGHRAARWRELLHAAWNRYGLPVALTEVHLGCTRDEQLRWFHDAWTESLEARREGVDVRALTAWSLLGTYDWNSLVTNCVGHYEPGVFDVRGAAPRPTAVARFVRKLAAREPADHPVLDTPGWWRRPSRILYGRAETQAAQANATQANAKRTKDAAATCARHPKRRVRPLLITGATGTLGRAFARICEARGLEYRLSTRCELDICDDASIDRAIAELSPWAAINAAGYVRVDHAEHEPARCYRENSEGPKALARACARRSLPMLTFSSDLVFDGTARRPYVESGHVAPLNTYGRSKAAAETGVLEHYPEALVVRTSSFFGPWDEYNFLTQALRTLSAGETFVAVSDLTMSPTYVPDLVNACLDLLIDGEHGLWHVANRGCVSWLELASQGARAAGIDASRLQPQDCDTAGYLARRPAFSALDSERGALLPSLDDALGRYADAIR